MCTSSLMGSSVNIWATKGSALYSGATAVRRSRPDRTRRDPSSPFKLLSDPSPPPTARSSPLPCLPASSSGRYHCWSRWWRPSMTPMTPKPTTCPGSTNTARDSTSSAPTVRHWWRCGASSARCRAPTACGPLSASPRLRDLGSPRTAGGTTSTGPAWSGEWELLQRVRMHRSSPQSGIKAFYSALQSNSVNKEAITVDCDKDCYG